MESKANLNQTFFLWWYKEKFSHILAFLKFFYFYLADLFSVKMCFKTLFYPWKRDQLSYSGLGLKEKLQVLMLNLISRFFGAFIKLSTLATFLVCVFLWSALAVVILAVWFLFPIYLLVIAIYGITLIVTK